MSKAMTTIDELNRREAEDLELVRAKYARLRQITPHVCERNRRVSFVASDFGGDTISFQWEPFCKHCGAVMNTPST